MRKSKKAWGPALLALLLAVGVCQPVLAQNFKPQPAPERIVAVGDIHGELDGFAAILQRAGLIDAARNWTGGQAVLVQTGDSIDRGPHLRGVLDLLMALEKQAGRSGGRVVALLGNHEAMNVYGDLRYVTAENFASFADKNSGKRRAEAWKDYVEWRKQRAAARHQPAPVIDEAAEQEWLQAHPLGFFEHRAAFAPQGKYGKWLRERPTVAQFGTAVFLHGGISPPLSKWTVEQLNKRIQEELVTFDQFRQALVDRKLILPFFTFSEMLAAVQTELNTRQAEIAAKSAEAAAAGKKYEPGAEEKRVNEQLAEFLGVRAWLMIHEDGPLWCRKYASWSNEEGAAEIEKLSAAYGGARFVVGHTPQTTGQIVSRFDGKVFLIDTGMLSSYYTWGKASALEIQKGKFTAIYPGQRVALLPPPAKSAAQPAAPLPRLLTPESEEETLGGGLPQAPQGVGSKNKPPSTQKPGSKTPEKNAPATQPGKTGAGNAPPGKSSSSTEEAEPAAVRETSPKTITQSAPETTPAANRPPPPESAAVHVVSPVRHAPAPRRMWLATDGGALVYQDDEQVLEFLRTARVVSLREIGQGITNPRKVLLEKDGLRINAIFRDIDEEKNMATFAGGRREIFFRDSYIFEVAAYRLSKMLGLDNVPPVVKRRINGQDGSLQLWIEKAFRETDRQKKKIKPEDVIQWNRQVQNMHVFDNLVYNTDRNMGNILIDPNWKLWMIDHTRGFRRNTDLLDARRIVVCERQLFERMLQLTEDSLKSALKDQLRAYEIEAILKRRDKLVAHLRGVITERTEEKVLFTWD